MGVVSIIRRFSLFGWDLGNLTPRRFIHRFIFLQLKKDSGLLSSNGITFETTLPENRSSV